MTATFDPLATSELIIDGYRRYLRSLLPVRDARIAAASIRRYREARSPRAVAGIRATVCARCDPG